MTNRQALLIGVILALLVFGAFAAEATLRNRVCISALMIDQTPTTIYYAPECS